MKILLWVMLMSTIIGCASPCVDDYQGTSPVINLQTFFQGDLVAYGIVRNRSGKVTRHFQAALSGHWQQGADGTMVGILDETFWFNDGEEQQRVWRLTPNGPDRYIGTAGDVNDTAKITVKGQAMNVLYQLVIPWNDSKVALNVDDWMYAVTPNVVINETRMTKWGFQVGKVTLVIMKAGVSDDIPALLNKVLVTTDAGLRSIASH